MASVQEVESPRLMLAKGVTEILDLNGRSSCYTRRRRYILLRLLHCSSRFSFYFGLISNADNQAQTLQEVEVVGQRPLGEIGAVWVEPACTRPAPSAYLEDSAGALGRNDSR
jgi:hypothetical protein